MLVGQRHLVKGPDGKWTCVKESLKDNTAPPPVVKYKVEKPVKVVKPPKEKKPPKVKAAPPAPFSPLDGGKYTITGVKVVKFRRCDPPLVNPVTGKLSYFVPLKSPVINVQIRGNHWPDGVYVVVKASHAGVHIIHPFDTEDRKPGPLDGTWTQDKGRKTSMGTLQARETFVKRFGPVTGDAVATLCGF